VQPPIPRRSRTIAPHPPGRVGSGRVRHPLSVIYTFNLLSPEDSRKFDRLAREAAERKAQEERQAREAAQRKIEQERLAREAAQRQAEVQRQAREAAERAAAAKRAAEQKAAAERKAREDAARRATQQKAAAERKAREAAQRRAAAEKKAEEERREALRRAMRGDALGAAGLPGGTAQRNQQGGRGDRGYAAAVRACIQPRVTYNVPPRQDRNNPTVQYRVTLAETGHVNQAQVLRSSGNLRFDEAVLKGIQGCSPFPRPPSGKYPPVIEGNYQMYEN